MKATIFAFFFFVSALGAVTITGTFEFAGKRTVVNPAVGIDEFYGSATYRIQFDENGFISRNITFGEGTKVFAWTGFYENRRRFLFSDYSGVSFDLTWSPVRDDRTVPLFKMAIPNPYWGVTLHSPLFTFNLDEGVGHAFWQWEIPLINSELPYGRIGYGAPQELDLVIQNHVSRSVPDGGSTLLLFGGVLFIGSIISALGYKYAPK